jgi:hypothetical protein
MYQIYAVELHVTQLVKKTLPSNTQAVPTLNHQNLGKHCTTQASVIFQFTYFSKNGLVQDPWRPSSFSAFLLFFIYYEHLNMLFQLQRLLEIQTQIIS